MKKAWSLPLLFGLILILTASTAMAQGGDSYYESFEGEINDWELGEGWMIIEEDGNKFLQGNGGSWAVLDRDFPGNFHLWIRMRLLAGGMHLVTHLSDQGRYFSGLEDGGLYLSKQYWPETFEDGLAESASPIQKGDWVEVEIVSQGDNLTLLINGNEEWFYQDTEKLIAGGFAFETLGDSLVQIDALAVDFSAEDLESESPPEDDAETEGDTDQADPQSNSGGGSGEWIYTGGPLGGLGYDVRMHPDNPEKMYVTDAYTGVFISEDGGENWYPSNKGISDRSGESRDAIPVFCLTIDPHNPDIIWSGTQFSGGIFKSTDGGKNWTRKTSGINIREGLSIRGITIDPVDQETLYAAGELSSWVWAGEPRNGREFDLTMGIVFKSSNGGESWTEIWRGDNLARYIWVNPEDNNIIYVSTGIFDREAANSDPVEGTPGGVGVIKSTDGGETWHEANNGLKNLYVGTLFMHPENPEILLAGTGNNQYHQNNGIYLTMDGARTWTHVFSGESEHNITSIEFSMTNPQIAYAGGDPNILRSEDGGHTWKMIHPNDYGWGSPGVRSGFPIDFQIDPQDPNRIFANNYGGGNFLSENGGKSWRTASTGYTGAQARAVNVDPEHPGLVYAAARSGIFRSEDGGDTWQGIADRNFYALEWNAVAVNPDNPTSILAATNWGSVLVYSSNGGESWRSALQVEFGNGVRDIAFAPSDPNFVYAGTGGFISAGSAQFDIPGVGVFVSSDGGQNWKSTMTDRFSDAHVSDLDVAPDNPMVVYAASFNYGVLRSKDGGESWEQVNQGLGRKKDIISVAIHPLDPEIIFAGMFTGGVYRSENGGENWQHSSTGLIPEAIISSIVIDHNNPDIVYAADQFTGVYQSQDGGRTWESFSEGLQMRVINHMSLSKDSAHLYAATEGGGVYRRDLAGYSPESVERFSDPEDGAEDEEEQPVEEGDFVPGGDGSSPTENGKGNQFCPTSYLPFLAGMMVYTGWKTQKRRKTSG